MFDRGRWPKHPETILAWLLVLGCVLWAYRFTPALGINCVDGWANVAGAKVESLADVWGLVSSPLTMGVAGDNANFYRPTSMLWFGALRGVFGTWGAGWQGASLLLHLCCVGLVAALARRLGGSRWEALAAGALLGLHPLGLDVVPAVDRSPDLLGSALVLGALLLGMKGRAVSAAILAIVALGAKETMLAGMPVLVALLWDRHGPRRALYALGLMAAFTALYLIVRTQVLGGMGGYASSTLRPQGLGNVLRAGALELLGAGWAEPLQAAFPSKIQQYLFGGMATFGLLGLAYAGRDEASVRLGFLLVLLPMLLLGLTAAFSRRTIYLPLTGFVLLVCAAICRTPWGKGLGILLAILLLPGSPLVRPDRAWSLAAKMDRSLTSGVVDQVAELPEGAELWVVDRCIQVDIDPWMMGLWRGGQGTAYCIATYSMEAYFEDQLGRPIAVHKVTNLFPERPPDTPELTFEDGSIVLPRPAADRRISRSAKDAGWQVEDRDGVLRLTPGGNVDKAWVLVAGTEEGTLVKAP